MTEDDIKRAHRLIEQRDEIERVVGELKGVRYRIMFERNDDASIEPETKIRIDRDLILAGLWCIHGECRRELAEIMARETEGIRKMPDVTTSATSSGAW
jgi:hypothetical protein